MQIILLYVSNTPLIVILCNRFSIGVNNELLREIESMFVICDCPWKGAIVHSLILLNVNTYANSVCSL